MISKKHTIIRKIELKIFSVNTGLIMITCNKHVIIFVIELKCMTRRNKICRYMYGVVVRVINTFPVID